MRTNLIPNYLLVALLSTGCSPSPTSAKSDPAETEQLLQRLLEGPPPVGRYQPIYIQDRAHLLDTTTGAAYAHNGSNWVLQTAPIDQPLTAPTQRIRKWNQSSRNFTP